MRAIRRGIGTSGAALALLGAGLQELAGGLTGTEPGQTNLLGQFAECGVDVVGELGVLHLDGQLDLVPLEGFERALHRRRSVTVMAGFGGRGPR